MRARSLRVAVVFFAIILIFFGVAFVFVPFLVWLLPAARFQRWSVRCPIGTNDLAGNRDGSNGSEAYHWA
jgi:hypothetical protein